MGIVGVGIVREICLPCVDSEHGDTKEGEGERLWDGEVHVVPFRGVVAAPMTCPFAGTRRSRTAYDEGTFAGKD